VRQYRRYGMSYRDVEELLAERDVEVDHVTVYRLVQRFTRCSRMNACQPDDAAVASPEDLPRACSSLEDRAPPAPSGFPGSIVTITGCAASGRSGRWSVVSHTGSADARSSSTALAGRRRRTR
jgi:hypothetical protein